MNGLTFGSVCSGIEAASVAFEPLGWKPAWFAEIEAFPSKVLAHHYPDVHNFVDMRRLPSLIAIGRAEAPDVLCGGTPCQAFSIAGLRKGLSDDRGALTLTFCEIANEIDTKRREQGKAPCIVIWENVVGCLSMADNAFGHLLAALAGEEEPFEPAGGKWSKSGCVFGPDRAIAWRVLNAQHFGVAQRRRRVVVVACPLERAHPTAILFELEGSGGNLESGGAPAQVDTGLSEGGSPADGIEQPYAVANCLTRRMYKGINTTLDEGQTPILAFVKGTNPHSKDECPTFRETETAACLNGWDERHNPPKHLVAYSTKLHNTKSNQAGKLYEEYTASLDRSSPPPALLTAAVVRKLMPVECERLMGFPFTRELLRITLCLDHQSGSVVVGLSCLRWPNSASHADAEKYPQRAGSAGEGLSTDQEGLKPLVAVLVRLGSEAELLELHSHGKLTWSANSADRQSWFPPPTLTESTVADVAAQSQLLALEARSGRGGSHQFTKLSIAAGSGSSSAQMSGKGTADCASTAGKGRPLGRYTTSDLGRLAPSRDLKMETWLCSVLAAISGFIPSETLPDSFSFEIDLEAGYTAIPGASDTQRYMALGNSWAVPMFTWLGARIEGQLAERQA